MSILDQPTYARTMKKVILLSILCAALHQRGLGQDQQAIDSLVNFLKMAKEDTVKSRALENICNLLIRNSVYDEALKYANQALELTDKLIAQTTDPGLLKAIYREKINAYNNIGIVYRQQGNYAEALKYHKTALQISQEHDYKGGMAPSYNFIATVNNREGDFPEALKNYFAALKVSEETGNQNGVASCYNNIGGIYMTQENYSEALKNFNISLKIKTTLGDKRGIANTNQNIGEAYSHLGRNTDALEYFLAALQLRQEIGDKDGIAKSYDWMGTAHYNLGHYEDALKNHLSAIKIGEQIGGKYVLSLVMKNAGLDYGALNQHSKAIAYLMKAIQLAAEIKAKSVREESYQALSGIYEHQGDFNNALKYHKLYAFLKDSIYNEARSMQMAEMKTKYETERKDDEISLLNKENAMKDAEMKRQKLVKNVFIAGLGLLGLLSIFVFNNFRVTNKLRLESIRNKIASDLHDDIGSTLNSISVYSEVAKQKSPTAIHELDQIGDASRKIIDAMSDIVWTINTKNDNFEQIILKLRSLTYNLFRAKNIEHTFRADESLNAIKLPIEVKRNFYLIFKEALNNLVKYSNATQASISLTLENSFIVLYIRDNGVGFNTGESSSGNGLLNMKARADEMKANLKIESALGEGTHVELKLRA